jgi:hypothetical protein
MRNVIDLTEGARGTISCSQKRRADRHPRHHAPEEKHPFAVHLGSHARHHPGAGQTADRRRRCVSLSAGDNRGIPVTAEELAARMASAGFKGTGFRRYMFGTVAIHWGAK